MRDYITTIILLGVMGIVLMVISGWIFGEGGLYLGLFLVIGISFVSYFFSEQIALKANRAKPLLKSDYPQIYHTVDRLSTQMGIPMPDLYYTKSRQANAFATGRNPKHASVVVTTGIMEVLDGKEIEGVLAHELGHIRSRDILTASIASVLAGLITFAARLRYINTGKNGLTSLLIALTVPIGATMLQMAISRQREFEADETAAETMGSGDPLADALIKIQKSASSSPLKVNPSYSNLYISNPFGALKGVSKLFSTHPPTEERIARLRGMRFPEDS